MTVDSPNLRGRGLRFPLEGLARSAEEAASLACEFRVGGRPTPVALKIASPDVTHKTDAGGVVLGVSGRSAVMRAFHGVVDRVKAHSPEARIDGVLVQEMVPPGAEAIIGLNRDPVFGPVIMFGLGGVQTELLRDVAFRPLPLGRADALDMVGSLRMRALLEGFRGGPRVDLDLLADLLVTVGRYGEDVAPYLGSVDLNPVVLWDDDYRVVDAKVLLEDEACPLGVEPPDTRHLERFFDARSVAVVGASPVPGKIGYFVLDSLAHHEYRGKVYPVNPNRGEVLGIRSYPRVKDIDGPVDLAVMTAPLEAVPALLGECAEKGCTSLVIISGGGKETGPKRAELEQRIRDQALASGIRIVGCNCIGVFDGESRLDTFFQTHERMLRPASGRAALVTQSGTVGGVFLEAMEHIGVSRFVSFGNRIDVDEADLMAFLADDPRTDVIAVYCEGFRSGTKFTRAAREAARRKPVVIYKSARTAEAAVAAVSHTGFYGGSYEVALGAFHQAGILAVDSIEELVASTKALGCLPVAGSNRVAMITNGAGTTVQAVDILGAYGLTLAELSPATLSTLRLVYPEFYQVSSVVDVTGSATTRDYMTGIEHLAADPGVDIVMPWFVLQDTPLEDSFSEALVPFARVSVKPIVCGASGGPYTASVRTRLEKQGLPLFGSVREWVAAARSLSERGRVTAAAGASEAGR